MCRRYWLRALASMVVLVILGWLVGLGGRNQSITAVSRKRSTRARYIAFAIFAALGTWALYTYASPARPNNPYYFEIFPPSVQADHYIVPDSLHISLDDYLPDELFMRIDVTWPVTVVDKSAIIPPRLVKNQYPVGGGQVVQAEQPDIGSVPDSSMSTDSLGRISMSFVRLYGSDLAGRVMRNGSAIRVGIPRALASGASDSYSYRYSCYHAPSDWVIVASSLVDPGATCSGISEVEVPPSGTLGLTEVSWTDESTARLERAALFLSALGAGIVAAMIVEFFKTYSG